MSIYYEKDGGDKDARDFATMRRDMRRREGVEDLTIAGQSFENKIGAFEQHTKVSCNVTYFAKFSLFFKSVT